MEIDKAIGLIEAHGVFHGDREKLGHLGKAGTPTFFTREKLGHPPF